MRRALLVLALLVGLVPADTLAGAPMSGSTPPNKLVGFSTAGLPAPCENGSASFDKTVNELKTCIAGVWTLASSPPTGAAGGDLGSTYPNPTVVNINGALLGTTTATAGNLLVGSGALWNTRAVSGDATLSSTGALSLVATGTASTYRSVTTDAAGRVSAGTNPTTMAGYGLTDVVQLQATTGSPQTGFANLSAGMMVAQDTGANNQLRVGPSTFFSATGGNGLHVSRNVQTGASSAIFAVSQSADTGQTSDLSTVWIRPATISWTGAGATTTLRRKFLIQADTLAADDAGGRTFTTSATLSVTPANAGTNGTIVNSVAYAVPAGGAITGTVTNSYGFLGYPVTGATNNYAAAFVGKTGIGTAAPGSTLDVSGSVSFKPCAISSAVALDASDCSFYECTSGAGIAPTLPACVAGNIGRHYIVKKVDAPLTSCTITRASADTIDGATTYAVGPTQYASAEFICGATAGSWWVH